MNRKKNNPYYDKGSDLPDNEADEAIDLPEPLDESLWPGSGRGVLEPHKMIVGVLQMQVSVFDAMTLKDKRRVIKSLKDRIGNKFNVSIAEVGLHDSVRTAVIGVAMVANEKIFVDSVLCKIVDFVRKIPQLTLIDYSWETF